MSWWDIIKRDKTPEEDWEALREQLPPQPKKPPAKPYTKPFKSRGSAHPRTAVPPEQRDRSRGAVYDGHVYRFLREALNIPPERAAELEFNGVKLGSMLRFGYLSKLTEEEFGHVLRAQEQQNNQIAVNLLMEFLEKAKNRVHAQRQQKEAEDKRLAREAEMRRRQQNED